MSVDDNFFKVFTVSFLSGNDSAPFADINSAVITGTTASLLFGDKNPLGQEVLIWNNIPVTITGVIKDLPDNSSISAGLLLNSDNDKFKFYQSTGNSNDLSTYRWLFQIYFQLRDGTSTDALAAKINSSAYLLDPYEE